MSETKNILGEPYYRHPGAHTFMRDGTCLKCGAPLCRNACCGSAAVEGSQYCKRHLQAPTDTNSHAVRKARGAMVPAVDLEAHERDLERQSGCGDV